jgi:protein-disulfide isomerase
MAPNQRPFYIALGVVVVGGGAFIASRVIGGNRPISIPANVEVTAADTAGFRGYTMGSPTAPIEVVEYGDLECPNCASFATVQFPDIKARLIDPGKVLYRYRDFPLDSPHKHPRVAAHAAACADEQGKYWEVQAAMFQRQPDYALVDNPMGPLTDIMKGAGLDIDKWTTCMKSAKFAGRIQATGNQATALGMTGTPSFLIGGRIYSNMASETMVKLVDSLIAAGPAPAKVTGAPKPTGGQ